MATQENDLAPATAASGALYPLRTWRKPDTRSFLILVASVLLLGIGGILIEQTALGLALALTAGVGGLAALGVVQYRLLLVQLEQERRHAQALAALHKVLPLRAPLPPLAGWAATPELAAVVLSEILACRPKRIVEAGSGVSTLVSGYALEMLDEGGKVVSLDHDAAFAAETRHQVARHGLSNVAHVFHAPLESATVNGRESVWYALDAVDDTPIDLLVVDGPPYESRPRARYPAVPLLWKRLSPTAVIIMDDARRKDEQKSVAEWRRAFPELRLEWVNSIKGIAVLRRSPDASA